MLAWCQMNAPNYWQNNGILKVVLDFSQCQKYIDKGSWVSSTLVTQLRNYNLFYFESSTEFDLMSEERPELSGKWRILELF